MPANTDCRAIPHPLDSDRIDVAGDMTRLANKVDDDLCMLFTHASTARTAVNRLPLLQRGFWNGDSDGNGYCRISWGIAYPGIPASGDNGNITNVGATCIGARGAGTALQALSPATYLLGGFNAQNAIIRVFFAYGPNIGTPARNAYCVFHWMVWGPNPNPVS